MAMLIGFLLWCASPIPFAAATTNTFPPAPQTSLDSAASNDGAVGPEEDSDQDRRVKRRLLTVALGGGVLLLLLAFAYVYLRLELTTRGFYSGRLQLVSAIASLSVVTAAYFLWRWLANV